MIFDKHQLNDSQSRVSEIWKTGFDINKLQAHLHDYVLPLESVQQSSGFGGWAVTSSNGSYKDGWQMGHVQVKPNMTKEEIWQGMQKAGLKPIQNYILPTEICHGYLKHIMDFIQDHGLTPARARIVKLMPNFASSWHRDAPENIYCVRLHVPIITNEGCFFETENAREHLPADGSSYFIFVNRIHRVVNNGEAPRFHLIVDVRDYKGISQHHRYL